MGDVLWHYLTREEMLEVQRKAETPDHHGSLFMGEKILTYHEWMGTDDHWRGALMLADGTRVVIEQRE